MTMENSSNVDQPSKWKLPILIAGFVIVVALVFYFVFEGTKNDITILNAGKKIEAKTHAATVGEALDESGIKLGAHDEVSPSKNTKIKDGMEIKFSNASQVNITDNGNETKVWSTKATVKELLKDENITTRPHDVVNVALDTKLKDGLNIKIDRAIKLVLQNGAQKEQVWSTKANVGDLLEEKNIKLQKDDRVSPAKQTALKEDMAILVTYVDKKAEEKTENIGFDTVYKNDASLKKGETKVISAGKSGSKKVKYEIVLENGKEKARKRISESVITKSENQIVARGTKEVQTVSVSHSSKPKASSVNRSSNVAAPSGGKTFTMQSTAYTGGGRTATGINLSANPGLKVVAVDPSVIPLGSKVWVEGYGVAIAGDTGGAIKGNIVDVYFPDHGSCVNWGRRTVTVRVL